jgi:hypothetical protein
LTITAPPKARPDNIAKHDLFIICLLSVWKILGPFNWKAASDMPLRFKRTKRKTANLFFCQAETERPKADNWQALRLQNRDVLQRQGDLED